MISVSEKDNVCDLCAGCNLNIKLLYWIIFFFCINDLKTRAFHLLENSCIPARKFHRGIYFIVITNVNLASLSSKSGCGLIHAQARAFVKNKCRCKMTI